MSRIPAGWTSRPLRECVEILDRHRVPINAEERERRREGKPPDALYPYFGATGQIDLIDGFIFDEELVLLGEDGAPFLDRDRPKAYRVSGRCWVNNHAHVLRPRQDVVHGAYLCAYLNHFDYGGYVTGSTRLKLTQAAMQSIPVLLAPLHEQKRIAAKLDRLFAAIGICKARLDAIPNIIERLRQSVIAAATSRELMRKWTGRVGVGRDQPTDFPVKRLAALLSEPLRGGRSVADGEGAEVLRLTSLKRLYVDLTETKHGRWSVEEARSFFVQGDDFLISRGSGSRHLVGRGALVQPDPGKIAFPDTLIRVRVDPRQILPRYLSIAWSSQTVRRQIEGIARMSAGIWKVRQVDLEKVCLAVPSLDEQIQIIRIVESSFSNGARLQANVMRGLERLDKLARNLLTKAFSGELHDAQEK